MTTPSKGLSEGFSAESPDAGSAAPINRTATEQLAIRDPDIPQYSDSIKETWRIVNAGPPQAKGAERFLNKLATVQDSVTLSDGQQAVVNTLAAPVQALISAPQIVAEVERGVNTFMEAVPVLIKTLDEVGKIHPFIQVAVLAFKAVYTLEVKRRDNEKKVIALYTEMKDMMTVLVDLKGVSDPKKVAPDGQTIEGRMQKLCAEVAQDIKRCANTCDTYRKKRTLVKVISGPIWEERLLEFVKIFTERRKQFQFALTIHVTVGVDKANDKLDKVGDTIVEVNQRMQLMMEMFQRFVTPEQRQLAFLVKEKGGEAVINNKQVMKELSEKEASMTVPTGRERDKSIKESDLAEIQQEVREDPATAIDKNMKSFDSKFEMQRRQIQEDIERVVGREGDRVISAVTAGPHERISDPDLHKIWKEMGWRGSVKARHFVLALKDYYVEISAGGDGEGFPSPDQWALEYIGVNYVRSILEAFDDDASGFVTIKEANNFTRSRPRDWSLPHWIAYWAIGWQMTSTNYCENIEEIFDAMIRLSGEVLPENRKEVNKYINGVWGAVITLLRSFNREGGTEDLRTKFQSHVSAEEERLRKNLEDINYDLDSYYAVDLVSGHRRIETTLLLILYLILKRDLQKISLARKHVLADSELPRTVVAIQWIFYAVSYRVFDLRVIFEQRNLSSKEEFAVFAKGLFNIRSEGSPFHGDKLRELPDPIPARDEIIPDPDSVPLSILAHPPGSEDELDFAAYDNSVPTTPPPGDESDAVLGTYYGFIYVDQDPLRPMIRWTLNRGSEPNTIAASGTQYYAGYNQTCTITGTTGLLEDGRMQVELEMSYAWMWLSIHMTGHFDSEENSLRGTMTRLDGTVGEFLFKRNPDFVRLYPAPSTINARARWNFAITVVLDRIRQRSWSPPHILKRIKDGRRYVELAIREEYYGKNLDLDETAEYNKLISSLYENDVRFYASLINIKLSKVPIQPIRCDSCDATLGGARVFCMDCHNDWSTVDLCSEPECLNSVVTSQSQPHLKAPHTSNHNVLKVHRILFDRDTARVERNAKYALEAAQATLSDLKAKKKPMPKCVHCQTEVSLPCWYCVDCTEEKFICERCEYERSAFNETHTEKHTLVRVIKKVEESILSTEEQLRSLQEELSVVRQLLSRLLEKSAEGRPSDPLTKGDILDMATTKPGLVGSLPKAENGQGEECQAVGSIQGKV